MTRLSSCGRGAVREARPEIYMKVIASILPRELHFKSANAFDGMSDEELSTLLVER